MHSRSEPPPPPEVEALLAHDGWLRGVVSQLIADHQVDDVLQETWLAALGQPSDRGRGWLRVVARRLAFRARREEARRQMREAAVARRDAEPSAGSAVQRLELQQKVTRALLALREPYRATLLQRYFEDRGTEEIAEIHGCSPATVRTRLHRGLALLRDALVSQEDRRRALAAVPVAALPVARSKRTVGWEMLVMTTKTKVCLGLLAVLLLGGLALTWRGGAPADAPIDAARAQSVSPLQSAESETGGEPAASRELLDVPAEESGVAGATPVAEPDVIVVEGFVHDARGVPIAHAEVYHRPGTEERGVARGVDHTVFDAGELGWTRLGTSAADGSFRVEVEDRSGWLVVGPPHVAVRPGPLRRSAVEPVVIVAAPAVSLAGVVTDEAGNPLADVGVEGFCERVTSYPGVLDRHPRPEFAGGTTDREGRFTLSRIPGCRAVVYTFALVGYESARIPAPETDRMEMRVVLRSHDSDNAYAFTGRVLDAVGEPVEGAVVGLGELRTTSGANGSYRLAVPDPEDEDVLFAVAEGFLAAVEQDAVAAAREDRARSHHTDLHLRSSRWSIAGRVLRADGSPWAGVTVYPWDLAYLGSSQFTVEGWEVGADHEWIGPSAKADEDGAFEVTGLDDRAYVLRILDEAATFGFNSRPIAAGSAGVEIRMDSAAMRASVAGAVVDGQGRGIEGVKVALRVDVRMRDGQGVFRMGHPAVTDASGAFELRDVPRDEALLMLNGEAILPSSRVLEPEESGVGLRIVVARRCQLRVEARSAPEGALFRVLDANGDRLPICQFTGGGRIERDEWELTDGRTQILTVPDSAREVVLVHEENELSRRSLALQPGVVDEVRF